MALGDQEYTATVDATGTATIDIRPPSRTRRWTVSQLTVELVDDAAAPLLARAEKNGFLAFLFIAAGDVVAGDPPIVLRPRDLLRLLWENCTPGKSARAFVIYDEESELV